MNSSAALKAFVGRHGGAVCTSSNARAVLTGPSPRAATGEPRGDKVLFFPDQHLGRNTGYQLGWAEEDMAVWDPRSDSGGLGDADVKAATFLLWKGHCSVHQRFRPEHVDGVPGRAPRRASSSSTPSAPTTWSSWPTRSDRPTTSSSAVERRRPGSVIGVGTEIHLVKRSADEHPDKTVVSLDPLMCPCSTMFRIDAAHLCWVLEGLVDGRGAQPDHRRPRDRRRGPGVALERMLDIT